MDISNIAKKTGWRFVAVSALVLVFGLAIALPFSTPTAVGYVQLPGVLIGVVVACVCVTCFFLCPRHPLIPKIVAGLLCVPALFCALDFVAHYWLHVRHHG
jgi:hypothetical protein